MQKQLLVGSIFRDGGPDQAEWLELQLKFLRATTPSFDHVSYVNSPKHDLLQDFDTTFVNSEVADTSTALTVTSQQHINGLNGLLSYFKKQRHNYTYFLFLDNDAFPIRKDWLRSLVTKMDDHSRQIAVAVRPENLEYRWHASILFARHSSLDSLRFGLDKLPAADFMGFDELDVGVGAFQGKLRDQVWPLIRTNQVNLHPVAYGVYFDMFYHHTFGGRRHSKFTRSRDFGLACKIHNNEPGFEGRSMPQRNETGKPWDTLRFGRHHYATDYIDPEYSWEQYTKDLMNDPAGFVSKLAGWNPDQYAILE